MAPQLFQRSRNSLKSSKRKVSPCNGQLDQLANGCSQGCSETCSQTSAQRSGDLMPDCQTGSFTSQSSTSTQVFGSASCQQMSSATAIPASTQQLLRQAAEETMVHALPSLHTSATAPSPSYSKVNTGSDRCHHDCSDCGSASPSSSSSTQGCSDQFEEAPQFQRVMDLQQGASGTVALALDRLTQKKVAIKYIPRSAKVPDDVVAQEILTQRQCLMHPHVIQFREVFLTKEHMGIAMEYAAGGDLREYMEQCAASASTPSNGLPENDARWFFQQLMLAVDYCHKLGIAHRDIKLENALLDRASPRAMLKLCDFGYSNSCRSNPSGAIPCRRAVGTPEYMAPELLTCRESYDGKAADVWSCGVMLYVMLTASFPFWRPSDDSASKDSVSRLKCMLTRIVAARYQLPAYLSPQAADLLKCMLQPDPAKRISVAQVMQHPWFTHALPAGIHELNATLLRMPAHQRTSFCRQSEWDIVNVTRQACSAPAS